MSKLNKTGIKPVEYRILVRMHDVEETMNKESLIVIPDEVKEKHQAAHTIATLLDKGGLAFDKWGKDEDFPVGTKVIISKYAGDIIPGHEKENLRLCNDKDIVAVLEDKHE